MFVMTTYCSEMVTKSLPSVLIFLFVMFIIINMLEKQSKVDHSSSDDIQKMLNL